MKKIIMAALLAMTVNVQPTSSGHFFVPNTELKMPPRPSYQMLVSVSHYSVNERECGKTDGITASGEMVCEGRTIAMENVPFFSEVDINGHIYTVTDRFGHGRDGFVDVYIEDEDRAWKLGRYDAVVTVYPKEVVSVE